MLRNLVNEVVSRRMWPIPLVAILIAIAAPLIFMKSGGETSASLAPPPVATPGELPESAAMLTSNKDKDAASGKKNTGKGRDPFEPAVKPKKPATEAAAAAPSSAPAAAGTSGNPVPVVIQNSDGSSSTMSVPSGRKTATAPKGSTTKKSSPTQKKSTSTRKSTKTTSPATSRSTETSTYVDVRFGERKDTYLRYRVPRLQTFRAGGRIAAMFVRYSAKRRVAVFAVAPSTIVKGDVQCREVKGVCRYVDLPAGSYARLVLKDLDGKLISRRLDVVSIRKVRGAEDASPREQPLDTATCLLKSLLRLAPGVTSITSDACA